MTVTVFYLKIVSGLEKDAQDLLRRTILFHLM